MQEKEKPTQETTQKEEADFWKEVKYDRESNESER